MLKFGFYEIFVTGKNYVSIMEKGIAQNRDVFCITQITSLYRGTSTKHKR